MLKTAATRSKWDRFFSIPREEKKNQNHIPYLVSTLHFKMIKNPFN